MRRSRYESLLARSVENTSTAGSLEERERERERESFPVPLPGPGSKPQIKRKRKKEERRRNAARKDNMPSKTTAVIASVCILGTISRAHHA